jgi:hypothetical protein
LEVDIKECKKQYAKERDNDINEEVKKFELEIEETREPVAHADLELRGHYE